MNFQTTGTMARELEAEFNTPFDPQDIAHALRRLRIEPTGRAGTTRLFGVDAVEAVRRYLQAHSRKLRQRQTSCAT